MIKKIMFVSGEESGDELGRQLALSIKEISPQTQMFAMGGERMKKAGVKILINSEKLAVVGIIEAIKNLSKILKTMRDLLKYIIKIKPNAIILIDYPGFNLMLAKKIKKHINTKIIYYVSPQIWAWRYNRIKIIKKNIDLMITLFKFEEEMYKKENIRAFCGNHPLIQNYIENTKEEICKQLNLNKNNKIIALLPGSRQGEIKKLMPILLETKALLSKKITNVQFIIPATNSMVKLLNTYDLKKEKIKLINIPVQKCIKACTLAIAACGTATLEIAINKVPLIIIYKLNFISFLIGKLCIKTKHVGLCNIIAKKEIAKEFIQGQAKSKHIAKEAIKILTNNQYRMHLIDEMKNCKKILQAENPSKNTAKYLLQFLTNPDVANS